MACRGVESIPCPLIPLLPGSGLTPCLSLVFGASDIDRERDAFSVVFGGEVISFGGGHIVMLSRFRSEFQRRFWRQQ